MGCTWIESQRLQVLVKNDSFIRRTVQIDALTNKENIASLPPD